MLPSRFYSLFDHMNLSSAYDMKCDIYEHDRCYYVEADIPGFTKDEINVSFSKGNVTISAEKKEEKETEEKKYLHRERYFGKCVRTFYIGEVDESKIRAKFNNGTLVIIAPKKQVENLQKMIEIQ